MLGGGIPAKLPPLFDVKKSFIDWGKSSQPVSAHRHNWKRISALIHVSPPHPTKNTHRSDTDEDTHTHRHSHTHTRTHNTRSTHTNLRQNTHTAPHTCTQTHTPTCVHTCAAMRRHLGAGMCRHIHAHVHILASTYVIDVRAMKK